MNCPHRIAFWIVSLISVFRVHSLAAADEVPTPSQTPCHVIVHGRTSTLKSIVVKKVGQHIPRIFHGQHTCKNTPGFDWYVSQHYALKANVGDELAKEFLTQVELAYPHYVEIIGREPSGIEDTRLAFVHATDLPSLQKAVISDIGTHWVGDGGGVTLPHSFAAYNYPSGGLSYHRHDINIHECLHLQQVVVQQGFFTPVRFTEGITYALANHVYDPERKRLTVAVFDKAPINNPIDASLRLMRTKGALSLDDVMRGKVPSEYGHGALGLYTAFFWSDPERLMKWRLWRDEMFRLGKDPRVQPLDRELLRELSGGTLDRLESDWRDWLGTRRTTFTHVDWGWEQWGDTLQSYGWPWNKEYFSQMDINLPPGKKLRPDPLRMDYPRTPRPAIVGAIQLGAAEPTVGCVVDFSQAEASPGSFTGWAGLGLGVDGRKLLRVVVQENKELVLDGALLNLDAGRKNTAFTPEVLSAARSQRRVGLTIKIAPAAVVVTVRAGTGDDIKEMAVSYPITAEERRGLLERHMAALSRHARHLITPYLEEPTGPTEDYTQAAPANRWHFAADHETYRLYRAVWRLGASAPASLLTLKKQMLTAMDKDADTQKEALLAYRAQIGPVLRDVSQLQGTEAMEVTRELSGIGMSIRMETAADTGKPQLIVGVRAPAESKVKGTVTFTIEPANAAAVARPKELEVEPAKDGSVFWTLTLPAENGAFRVTALAKLSVNGVSLSVSESRKFKYRLVWSEDQ
jgi:hypothetical protein